METGIHRPKAPANAYSLSRKGNYSTPAFTTGFSMSHQSSSPPKALCLLGLRFGGRPNGRTAGRAPERTPPLRCGDYRAFEPASTGCFGHTPHGDRDQPAEGPCQCLLVIKERQSLQSSGHDWVLNKRSTECSTGGPVLTGPALRRASRRSHGRPCAGMDVPPPLWVLQGISASFYGRRRPKHRWGLR